MIAALYAWTKDRDARQYWGPHPVVAHPDCGPWSKLRHMCTKQDRSCAPIALAQVREFGGVLEHPEFSRLWYQFDLPLPECGDGFGGASYRVDQCDWGHKCRKSTWLYVVGPPSAHEWVSRHLDARSGTGTPTHCVCTGPRQKERLPVATKLVKRITPPAFAELLIEIARRCQ